MLALSVSISARTSPFFIWSPGFLSHCEIVPSCIVSLRRGMVTSDMAYPPAARRQFSDRFNQLLRACERGQFQRFGIGKRHLQATNPFDGGIQVVAGLFLQHGSKLRADTEAAPVLFKDDGASRLLHGVDQRLAIKRSE